jgi:rhamnosyltransferase
MKLNNIVAIVILYNPDLDCLNESLNSLIKQVDSVILVDNSIDNNKTSIFLEKINLDNIQYLSQGANLGVAKAQNIGILNAISQDYEYCLIMDQDSIVSEGMVFQLVEDYIFLKSRKINLAVIGPTPINKISQKEYSPRLRKNYPFFKDYSHLVKVSELISSGSLINLKTFDDTGLMDENLFIDGVDHEWCWRAKKQGFLCAMSKNAKLEHMLGEGDKKILGISVAISSPFRVYYQYRNFIYLSKKKYVPIYWKINNAFKYLIKFFYYPFFISPRFKYLNNIIRGILAGLKG